RVARAEAGDAERLRELQEVGVREIAGDRAVAVLLLLDAPDVAEAAVVEDHDDDGQIVLTGGRELAHLVEEAAVAGNGEHRLGGLGRLDAEGCAEAPAEIVLVAGRKEGARLEHRKGEAGDEADLRHLVDEDAVLRERRPDRLEEAQLRLE